MSIVYVLCGILLGIFFGGIMFYLTSKNKSREPFYIYNHCDHCKHHHIANIKLIDYAGTKVAVMDYGYCEDCVYRLDSDRLVDKFEELEKDDVIDAINTSL